LRESVIAHPADTIVFGEKASASIQFYVVLAADATQYLPIWKKAGTAARGCCLAKAAAPTMRLATAVCGRSAMAKVCAPSTLGGH